jgi:hypothetical protein
MVQVEILCDRVRGTRDPCHADFAGFLLAAVGGLFFDLLFTGLRDRRVKYGDEVSILVPLPVCEVCREMLNGINLRQAVLQIPEYAELLDHYPNAEITRRG